MRIVGRIRLGRQRDIGDQASLNIALAALQKLHEQLEGQGFICYRITWSLELHNQRVTAIEIAAHFQLPLSNSKGCQSNWLSIRKQHRIIRTSRRERTAARAINEPNFLVPIRNRHEECTIKNHFHIIRPPDFYIKASLALAINQGTKHSELLIDSGKRVCNQNCRAVDQTNITSLLLYDHLFANQKTSSRGTNAHCSPSPYSMILQRELVILAQRVALPVFVEKNAREVGMAREPDAAEVVDLALMPVGTGPDLG